MRQTKPAASGWKIFCDFDGTISVEDVVDSLLERFGRPGCEALERDWREGRIGSRECMSGQIELLDMSRAQLDRHVAQSQIDPHFPEFVADARRSGAALSILSDGLDEVIRAILGRVGLAGLPISANRLRPAGRRRWRLDSPFQRPGCGSGTCKCECVERGRGQPGSRTLLIGDGASDFCAARQVDFVFAKRDLLERCRREGIPCLPIADFREARALLPALLEDRALCPVPSEITA